MDKKQLIQKINELSFQKETEIQNGNYERAAQLRDEIQEYQQKLSEMLGC